MHFTQATLALAFAVAGVAAIPVANEGGSPQGPPPSDNTCNGGSNMCLNEGVWSKKTTQDCTGGDAYCCSGEGALISCSNVLNGNEVSVLGRDLETRTNSGHPQGGSPQGPPPSNNVCNGGSNLCINQGIWSKKTKQDCTGGSSYCCKGSGALISCSNVGNGNAIHLSKRDLEERTQQSHPSQPQGPPPSNNVCNGGSNMCYNSGKWSKKTQQSCTGGDAYCCSGKGALISCSNVANGNTINLGLGEIIERL